MKPVDPGLAVADLMLGLAGVMFLVLAVVLAPSSAPQRPEGQFWLADAEGLVLETGQRIGLDALAEGRLPQPGPGVPVLVVAPDGLEAAFLMEAGAGRAGWPMLEIRRLSEPCPAIDPVGIVEGLSCLR